MRSFTLALVLSLTPVTPAFASDGVLEINQTCAVQTGCFSGDAAGSPVTIDGTAGNSYRLTSDLAVDQNTTAIRIHTDDIDLDLGGFKIKGPNYCTAGPGTVNCTYQSAGSGVVVDGGGTVVRHGTIRGMGASGVSIAGLHTTVDDLIVSMNGNYGISGAGVVRDSQAYFNGNVGISARTVLSSTASRNASGISAVLVSNCTVTENQGDGVRGGNATVVGSHIESNAGAGINMAGGMVSGNTVVSNGACGARFASVNGQSGAIGDNNFTNNFGCVGGGGQDQVSGNVIATSCNVVTCTTGSLLLGTFCPANTITCFP